MNEIINNRQQRVEIMKSLIRQLHNGVAEEQVKHQLIPRQADDPAWITGEPQFTVNGTELLQRGEVPLGRVNELLGKLEPDRYLLLVTNFEPTLILEAMQKQNRRAFHKTHPEAAQQWLTLIQ